MNKREVSIELEKNRIEQIIEKSFLADILKDDGITDIRFNGTELRLQHNERGYIKPKVNPSLDEVRKLARQIADAQKKAITHSEPILDTEIGFLRVNVMHDEVSPDGMTMAIRVSRPTLAVKSINDMTNSNNSNLEQLLKVLVQAGSNIIISGRTGSGKTELQKLLVGFIPDEPIVLIEDTRDSHIKSLYPEKDIMSWKTLLSDDRDKKITMQDLVKAGLRNNPVWMIISETRGIEASDMLDSAKTDHFIITTVHATKAMNIPSRLISMIKQSPAYQTMDTNLIGKEITELLKFGIHLELEFEDGIIKRKIKEIVEFEGYEDSGAKGRYLFRESREYDEKKDEYYIKEIINPLSEQTLAYLKDKKLYHLLPDEFKSSF